MKTLWTLLLIVLSAAPLYAEPIIIETDGAENGTYYYKITVKDGAATLSPLVNVVRLGKPTSPGPNDPPPPGQPSEFSKAIQALTKQTLDAGGSPTTAAGLSSVYSLVADGIKDGSISEANAFLAVKLATDTVMANVTDKDKWTKWRTDLSLALETLRQQGVLKLPATFYEVAAGVDLALGGSINPKKLAGLTAAQQGQIVNSDKLFENIDITKLIQLIMLLLELFKAFRPM